MNSVERLTLKALNRLDPEKAHGLALRALRTPFAPKPGPVTSSRLRTSIAGLDLPNPIGLAAGFDKNATAVDALSQSGFGFLEFGAATPRPQPGNARPRLFRLTADRAVINRFGFNNDGMYAIADRLKQARPLVAIGLNIGANKDSENKTGDYASVLETCGPFIDFATVNVSSPNTEGLRLLQAADALASILKSVLTARDGLAKRIPVFLKISPDLSDDEITTISEVSVAAAIDGIIATNTTLVRDGLSDPQATQAGGLSGAPLFDLSTRVLARFYMATNGKTPMIGVGGVSSAEDAYAKIRAGASAVQLYSAMVYQGLSLGAEIAKGLDQLLERDGLSSVSDAVGKDVGKWLRT